MFEDALIAWDEESDPVGNVQHIAQNGITMEEFEFILTDHRSQRGKSRSSGRATAWGILPDGREVVIVFDIESTNPLAIRPVTAYEPEN
jgi:uncharacterized DUF497 family protein